MKKLIQIMVFFIFTVSIYAAPSIVKMDTIKEDQSNAYFPLVVGQKWLYTVTAAGNETSLTWKINGQFRITDIENGLTNVPAYQVEAIETGEVWYYIDYDGFICKYMQDDDGSYLLVRLIPASVNVDYNWISDNTTFIVSEMNTTTVRVEFVDNSDDFSGYNIFKTGVGPIEMYIYDTAGGDKSDTIFKLKESGIDRGIQEAAVVIPAVDEVTPTASGTDKVTEATQPQEKIKQETSETPPPPKEEAVSVGKREDKAAPIVAASTPVEPVKELSIEERYPTVVKIKSLQKDMYYIQVGSFVIKDNAYRVCNDIKSKGYNAVLFEDDGYYKVLIEGNKDLELNLDKARNEINAGAFMKKRIK